MLDSSVLGWRRETAKRWTVGKEKKEKLREGWIDGEEKRIKDGYRDGWMDRRISHRQTDPDIKAKDERTDKGIREGCRGSRMKREREIYDKRG